MIFERIDKLKMELDSLRPLPPELMEVIDEKFKIDWTYNSNAIEGNTLTLQETAFFLQHGLTSKGKTLKEYLEAQNHAEAIDWLKEIIKQDRPITEGVIKELHALLLKGIDFIWVGPRENRAKKSITPGKYKTQPNHVVTLDGKIHKYCEPLKVPEEMERFVEFINKSDLHPVELAARAHHKFVAIHPFDDGNGRVARLLMNLILMRNGYLPVVIKNELREEYYRALMKADEGDEADFINLIAREEENSLQMVVNVAKEYYSK
ncbi:Fic family protein [Desulfohalotomaculum tongense]|uniref:Fic family protein n=1 Tax=Desulforadius tongensis TaxID=1216062 RepID=UPI001EE5C615|nr:Fic family protein [Desulforadius tongensis]MBM7856178.1 Fic family protein [Desulforadius tongensis]